MSSQTSVSPHSQGAQTPYHWLCLLAFHCNNHNCYFAFEPARGITARLCARKGAIGRPAWLHNRALSAQAVECPGCRGDKISTVPRVLPEKQCGTERVLPERLARPISQACTRIAWQPEASVLVPSRAHLQQMLKTKSCKQDPARQLTRFSREKIKTYLKNKNKRAGSTWPN